MPHAQGNNTGSRERLGRRNGLFIVLFISLLVSTARGWHYMDAAERQLQAFLAIPIVISTISTFLLPKPIADRYRTPALILCRLIAVLMPSFKIPIRMVMQSETPLGRKWGQNPLGAIAIVVFCSRCLSLGVSASAMPLDFIPTLLVQVLIGIASWPADLGLCSAKIVAAPDILLWLNGIHSLFSIIWGVCMPFFWTPLPPQHVVNPAVSFLAVTLFTLFCAGGFPVVQSVYREADRYRRHVMDWVSRNTTPSENNQYGTRGSHDLHHLQQQQQHRWVNYNSDDEDYELIESLFRMPINAPPPYTTAALNSNTTSDNGRHRNGGGGDGVDGGGRGSPSFPFPIRNSNSDYIAPFFAGYKRPPVAVRLYICYRKFLFFPAHTVWLIVVTFSLGWTLTYKMAERMCA